MQTRKLWMLAVVGAAVNVPAVTAEDGPDGKTLAWMRFENAPNQYAGKPYLWLGDRRIELAIDVKPAADYILYLLWGSKNDTRTAKIVVNGKSQTVEGGGYDGFQWKKVALPGHLTADNYQISIRQTGGKAAFLAEVRLVAPARKEDAADATRPAAHKIKRQPAPEPVFPPLPDDPLHRSAEIAGFTTSAISAMTWPSANRSTGTVWSRRSATWAKRGISTAGAVVRAGTLTKWPTLSRADSTYSTVCQSKMGEL